MPFLMEEEADLYRFQTGAFQKCQSDIRHALRLDDIFDYC